MKTKTSRRDFLKQTSLAGMGFWVAGGLTLADSKSPNEKINIACIGVGGKGDSDTDQAGNHGNIVALCDIDDHHLEAKASKFPNAKKYNDFRKMLEEMDKHIDAVTVSTPDHTHAPASIMAMNPDGTGQHAIVGRGSPFPAPLQGNYSSPTYSPDGNVIAFAASGSTIIVPRKAR